jgi:hypothetical protein
MTDPLFFEEEKNNETEEHKRNGLKIRDATATGLPEMWYAEK